MPSSLFQKQNLCRIISLVLIAVMGAGSIGYPAAQPMQYLAPASLCAVPVPVDPLHLVGENTVPPTRWNSGEVEAQLRQVIALVDEIVHADERAVPGWLLWVYRIFFHDRYNWLIGTAIGYGLGYCVEQGYLSERLALASAFWVKYVMGAGGFLLGIYIDWRTARHRRSSQKKIEAIVRQISPEALTKKLRPLSSSMNSVSTSLATQRVRAAELFPADLQIQFHQSLAVMRDLLAVLKRLSPRQYAVCKEPVEQFLSTARILESQFFIFTPQSQDPHIPLFAKEGLGEITEEIKIRVPLSQEQQQSCATIMDGLFDEQNIPYSQRYEPLEVLGTGGWGTAILVRARGQGPDNVQSYTVLKIISIDLTSPVKDKALATLTGKRETPGSDPQKLIEKVKSEIAVLKKINNPFVIQYLGSSSCEVIDPKTQAHILRYGILTSYFSHDTLDTYLQGSSDCSPASQMLILYEIAVGLAYLHGNQVGIIHRDIKEKNILIRHLQGQGPWIKIIDFGLIKEIGKEHSVLASGQAGTQGYMPGEMEKITRGFDIYSFGCVMEKSFPSLIRSDGDLSTLVARMKNPAEAYRPQAEELIRYFAQAYNREMGHALRQEVALLAHSINPPLSPFKKGGSADSGTLPPLKKDGSIPLVSQAGTAVPFSSKKGTDIPLFSKEGLGEINKKKEGPTHSPQTLLSLLSSLHWAVKDMGMPLSLSLKEQLMSLFGLLAARAGSEHDVCLELLYEILVFQTDSDSRTLFAKNLRSLCARYKARIFAIPALCELCMRKEPLLFAQHIRRLFPLLQPQVQQQALGYLVSLSQTQAVDLSCAEKGLWYYWQGQPKTGLSLMCQSQDARARQQALHTLFSADEKLYKPVVDTYLDNPDLFLRYEELLEFAESLPKGLRIQLHTHFLQGLQARQIVLTPVMLHTLKKYMGRRLLEQQGLIAPRPAIGTYLWRAGRFLILMITAPIWYPIRVLILRPIHWVRVRWNIWLLGSENAHVRTRAANTLVYLGITESQLQAIRGMLSWWGRRFYAGATEALGKLGDTASVPILIPRLVDFDSPVRCAAVEALCLLDPSRTAVWQACVQLTSRNAQERRQAAKALGALGAIAQPVVSLLIRELERSYQREDIPVYQSIAEALGKIGDSSAVPVLIHRLSIVDESALHAVVEALCSLGVDESQRKTIRDMLTSESLSDREGACWALGKLGDTASVPALIERLADENESVRSAAAQALSLLDPARAEVWKWIAQLKDNDVNMRRQAADELGKLGELAKDTVLVLIKILQDRDEGVRRAAVEALKVLADQSIIPQLKGLLMYEVACRAYRDVPVATWVVDSEGYYIEREGMWGLGPETVWVDATGHYEEKMEQKEVIFYRTEEDPLIRSLIDFFQTKPMGVPESVAASFAIPLSVKSAKEEQQAA